MKSVASTLNNFSISKAQITHFQITSAGPHYFKLGYLEFPLISHSKLFPLDLSFEHPLFRTIFRFPWEGLEGFNLICKHVCSGVAVEDDIYKEVRQQIEQELAHREAVETATRLLDEILEGVRTPERPRSPVDAYITVSGVIQVTGDSGT